MQKEAETAGVEMRGSPFTPPPATFSAPRVPAASFDVGEAMNHQRLAAPLVFNQQQLSFMKNAAVSLRENLASADREFLTLSYLPSYAQAKCEAALLPENRMKNRYGNVLPYDDTRVKLDASNGSTTDYINASFVVDSAQENVPAFIATQGPLNSTVADFWEMVVQKKCPAIIMLTRMVYDNEEKCAHYLPSEAKQSLQFGRHLVTNKSTSYLRDTRTLQRILEVRSVQNPRIVTHTVIHLEYLDWPDFGVPSSTSSVREIMRSLQCIPPTAGPIIVHCSAGIGRTGTFCVAYHTLVQLLAGHRSALNIGQTLVHFRSQRSGLVQTKDQYRFIFSLVIDELESLLAASRQS